MSIDSKIKEIYDAHKQSGLYYDSFENVIFKLINAYDYFYLEPFRNMIYRTHDYNLKDSNWEAIDAYRHALGACIKFVYEDCKRGEFNSKIDLDNLFRYQEEIKETVTFNCIRNAIDRYRLGRYSAKLVDDKLCFEHKQGRRALIYDIYSRCIANEIPGGKNSKDDIDVVNFNLKIAELASRKQEFQSKRLFKPANYVLKQMVCYLVDYYLGDLRSTKIGYLRANTYTLNEYLFVYCYLAAIGVYKTSYLLSLKSDNGLVYQPSILYPKERLISDISEVVNINKETVRAILKDMTYDYEFHKDKVTLYQPLFKVGDNILCSTNMLFYSKVIDKVMKYYDCKSVNKKYLTFYHRYMANKMNHRVAKNLPLMYSNLLTFENKTLVVGKLVKAEVDLIVFDTCSKTGALIELKNYTPVDNDADAQNKEKRINKAIKSRLEKDKRVLDNLEAFLEQNNISREYLNYRFSSLVVTNEYSGGVGIKENIKVLDEALFYYLLRLCYGNLKVFINLVEKGEFFNILEKNIKNADDVDFIYKGITVKILNR